MKYYNLTLSEAHLIAINTAISLVNYMQLDDGESSITKNMIAQFINVVAPANDIVIQTARLMEQSENIEMGESNINTETAAAVEKRLSEMRISKCIITELKGVE